MKIFAVLVWCLVWCGVAHAAAAYQLTDNGKPRDQQVIIRTLDRAYIPPDPGNVDYRVYLQWLGADNTPDPASPPAQ